MIRIAVLATFILLSPAAKAAVVVDQFPWDTFTGLRSNFPPAEVFEQQVADDFVWSSAKSLGKIEWTGYYLDTTFTQPTIDFTIRVFDPPPFAGSGRPKPGNSILSEQSVSAAFVNAGTTDTGNNTIYRFTATLPQTLSLTEDSTYWISILDSDPSTELDFRWFRFDDLNLDSTMAVRDSETLPWRGTITNMAFRLSDVTSVPEPSAFALPVLLSLTLIFRRSRGTNHAR